MPVTDRQQPGNLSMDARALASILNLRITFMLASGKRGDTDGIGPEITLHVERQACFFT